MNTFNKITFFILGVALTLAFNTQAQDLKTPAPSPTQTLKQNFALSDITIEYSRPSVKGRVVFGDLVPYGKMWRTGANASTKITFGEDVKVEGKDIKAGTYALYTIPTKDSWEIIFYKDLTLGGRTAEFKAENEAARFTVKPSAIGNKVETLTMNVANITSSSAEIEIVWDKTRVAFGVKADIDTKILGSIDKALAADSRPYFQAANYYYENDKDLAKALEWVNKAVEQNTKAFWVMMLKARIELKAKDKKAAIASAEKVITIATEAKNDDYIKMANDLIAEAKKK